MPAYPPTLACGQTVTGVNVPFRAGRTGVINANTTGPTIDVGPKPPRLLYGQTAGGVNVPILVDADGVVQFA